MNQNTSLFDLQTVNTVVQIASLIFLIIYVIKTWEMASATRKAAEATEKSVAEMKETRDQETAPYIVVYFDIPSGSRLIYLVVKNIGHSVAERIKLTFTPDLQTTIDTSLANLSFIKDGIESMPPEYEIRTILDGAPSYFGAAYLPLKYRVKISYFGGIQTSERIHEQTLDLSAHKGLMFTSQKDFGDLVDEVKGLHKELRDAQKAMGDIANVLKSGILINNPSFAITTIAPGMSTWMDSILAKLREFENLWLIAYKDERLKGTYISKLQNHILLLGGQLLLLLANRPFNAPSDLIVSISNLCERLEQLGRFRFFMGGDEPVNAFNEQGDQIIEQINNAVTLIEKFT